MLAEPLWKQEGILYADLDLNETLAAGQLLDAVGHYSRSEVLGLRFNTSARRRKFRTGCRSTHSVCLQ